MERPPKKYVCEKCGYLGDTSEHEGCNYLAWATGEQLYIDHLEAELAALRASPASASEGWKGFLQDLTQKISEAMDHTPDSFHREMVRLAHRAHKLLAASPTPPVSEDRKDAERYQWLVANSFDKSGVTQFHIWKHSWEPHSKTGEQIEWSQRISGPPLDAAIDAAMQEDTP